MTDPYREREYTEDDWAVGRWDRFNDYNWKDPLSFCQFWRTVLLWYTLSRIPLLGKMFLSHLYVPPPHGPRGEPSAFEVRLEEAAKSFGRVVWAFLQGIWWAIWLLIWPLRKLTYCLQRGFVSVVAFIDEHEQGKKLVRVCLAVVLLFFLAGVFVTMLVVGLINLWQYNQLVFTSVIGGVSSGIVLVILVAMFSEKLLPLGKFIVAFFSMIGSFLSMIWEILVISKHRVCPPMSIKRKEHSHAE